MSKLISRIVTTLALIAALALPVMVPAAAYAADATNNPTPQINEALCSGANLSTQPATNCSADASGSTVNTLIATVINILSLVVGVVAVIMIIVGGLKYITSGGDSSNITGAKNTILYAIIGLVFVALAQVIVRFVLGRATPAP